MTLLTLIDGYCVASALCFWLAVAMKRQALVIAGIALAMLSLIDYLGGGAIGACLVVAPAAAIALRMEHRRRSWIQAAQSAGIDQCLPHEEDLVLKLLRNWRERLSQRF